MSRRLKTLSACSTLLMLTTVAVAQSGVALPDPCEQVKGTKTLKQKTASGGQQEIDCRNGRQHGMHRVWHANGKKQFGGEYKDGWPIGTHRRWHANGQSPKLKRTYGYVATVKDDTVEEPRITLKEAIRILSRKVKFDPKKVSIVMVTPGGLLPELKTFTWAIYLPTPPGPSGISGSVAHFVDASTGEII